LMDEPFSALYPLIRRGLQDEFLELSRTMKKTTLVITHDLDEAIRMGNRIAIMKDGEIVQTGTPEEIVTQPADDYVADFVAHMNPLNVLQASDVVEAGTGVRDVPADMPLSEAMAQVLDTGEPLSVTENGTPIGRITAQSILSRLR